MLRRCFSCWRGFFVLHILCSFVGRVRGIFLRCFRLGLLWPFCRVRFVLGSLILCRVWRWFGRILLRLLYSVLRGCFGWGGRVRGLGRMCVCIWIGWVFVRGAFVGLLPSFLLPKVEWLWRVLRFCESVINIQVFVRLCCASLPRSLYDPYMLGTFLGSGLWVHTQQ